MRVLRLRGALLGAALGAAPAALLALWLSALNPWFLDDLPSYLIAGVLLPGFVGVAVGAWVARGRGGAALLALELAAIGWAAFRPRPDPVPLDLLVFGVDGATWKVADRLRLPTLEGLAERGARGVLRSEEPMFSPLLWTTIATGERPDAHGIRGFRTRSDQCRAARFWEVAASAGMAPGIYKWLVTWPPRAFPETGGFVVPAWLAPTPETWPDELSFVKEIELSHRMRRRRIGQVRPTWRLALAGAAHGLRWSTLLQAAWVATQRSRPEPWRAWRAQLLRVRMDRDTFVWALHEYRPRVATFTTYATDALAHTHWHLLERCVPAMGGTATRDCPPWAGAVADAYRQADAVLGELLREVQPGVRVVVVSDHGFRAAEEGDAARHFAPRTERLRARIEAEVGPVDVARLGHKVVITLLADDRDAERERLVAWLDRLVQGSTGSPFYRWEDLPDGTLGLTLADERVDEERLRTDTVGGEPLRDYVRLTERWTGEHDPAGIFLAAGPGIPEGERIGEASIVDVAPTLLALLGLPVGLDMPGRALFGEAEPRVGTHDALSHAEAAGGAPERAGEDDVNVEALRALGYIGE